MNVCCPCLSKCANPRLKLNLPAVPFVPPFLLVPVCLTSFGLFLCDPIASSVCVLLFSDHCFQWHHFCLSILQPPGRCTPFDLARKTKLFFSPTCKSQSFDNICCANVLLHHISTFTPVTVLSEGDLQNSFTEVAHHFAWNKLSGASFQGRSLRSIKRLLKLDFLPRWHLHFGAAIKCLTVKSSQQRVPWKVGNTINRCNTGSCISRRNSLWHASDLAPILLVMCPWPCFNGGVGCTSEKLTVGLSPNAGGHAPIWKAVALHRSNAGPPWEVEPLRANVIASSLPQRGAERFHDQVSPLRSLAIDIVQITIVPSRCEIRVYFSS